jgi:acetolactate synthase I/II/III large subunit
VRSRSQQIGSQDTSGLSQSNNVSLAANQTPKRASGGFALLDSLERHGVEYIFGYPGGAILPIYDDLYKVESAGSIIKHILVRHEQGAAHAADGYCHCLYGFNSDGGGNWSGF